ncbi:hypothetical protein OIU76_015893 [Salix suchowensis]|nr:hypothetical protein OIU76_015893 [Salix suchowensis]
MASSTLSAATPSQLCSSKSGLFSPTHAVFVKPARATMATKEKGMRIACQATSTPADDRVPDMGKRELMNLLLLGALSLPTAGMLVPYTYFFVPSGLGGGGGGTVAKDALGNDIVAEQWLKTHGPGDRTLSQGLKGDPTYLVVEKDKTLATYGINAVCTHLGTMTKEELSEDQLLCHWLWLTATLMTASGLFRNRGKTSSAIEVMSIASMHANDQLPSSNHVTFISKGGLHCKFQLVYSSTIVRVV